MKEVYDIDEIYDRDSCDAEMASLAQFIGCDYWTDSGDIDVDRAKIFLAQSQGDLFKDMQSVEFDIEYYWKRCVYDSYLYYEEMM